MTTTMIIANNDHPSMNVENEEEEEVWKLNNTFMVKKEAHLPKEVYEEIKFIFDTSYDRSNDGRPLPKNIDRTHIRRPHLYNKCILENRRMLEMPRRLPQKDDFSNNVLLVFEEPSYSNVMVLLVDWSEETKNVSLYHVLTKKFYNDPYCGTIGYAAFSGRLHFVGGTFLSNVLLDEVDGQPAQDMEPRNLNVPFFNLQTRVWEDNTNPHLKGSKSNAVVFVYDGNMFALEGYDPYHIYPKSHAFEVLDMKSKPNSSSQPSWNTLPRPPFDMEYYSHHILDNENGIFYLFFNFPGIIDDSSDATRPCCVLKLNEKPLVWCHNTLLPASDPRVGLVPSPKLIDPLSCVGLRMSHLSREDCSFGCIVDDIFFCYKGNHNGKSVIVGHDLSRPHIKFDQWVIDGLDEIFKLKFKPEFHYGYLIHIENLRFCLVITYLVGKVCRSNAIYSLTFDLLKENTHLEDKDR